jgi:hypothetical protein
MATGCLHSTHACAEYMRNVRAFKAAFQPHDYTELGDVLDTACLRSGARGTKDEGEPLEPDLRIGLDWVREMQPTRWMFGNHDTRVVELTAHPSAIVSELSRRLLEDMHKAAKDAGAKVYDYDIERGWARIGDAPVDVDKLNAFVEAYNRYIELLKGDVLDVKQWQKVLDKWERLK